MDENTPVNPFVLIAPIFLVFEIWQLVVSERYLGLKQIKVNAEPREMPMSPRMAALWAGGIVGYYVWMATLLLHPGSRAQGVVLLTTTAIGYALRSSSGLKRVLVILTFEGSIRIGMLLSLLGMAWRQFSL